MRSAAPDLMVVAVLVGLGCGTNRAPASSAAPSNDAASSSDVAVAIAPADSGSDASVDAADAASETFTFAEHYPPGDAVDLDAWLKARGVKQKGPAKPCWELAHVGVPAAPGLLCASVAKGQPPITTARLYRLEGAQLSVVWEETVATYANWLELTPVVAKDGASLVLQDRSPCACPRAIGEDRLKAESNAAVPGLSKVLGKACARLGTYRWSQGRYLRDDPQPAAFSTSCE